MFIWTAIDVDEQLLEIKKEAKRIETVIGFQDSIQHSFWMLMKQR